MRENAQKNQKTIFLQNLGPKTCVPFPAEQPELGGLGPTPNSIPIGFMTYKTSVFIVFAFNISRKLRSVLISAIRITYNKAFQLQRYTVCRRADVMHIRCS